MLIPPKRLYNYVHQIKMRRACMWKQRNKKQLQKKTTYSKNFTGDWLKYLHESCILVHIPGKQAHQNSCISNTPASNKCTKEFFKIFVFMQMKLDQIFKGKENPNRQRKWVVVTWQNRFTQMNWMKFKVSHCLQHDHKRCHFLVMKYLRFFTGIFATLHLAFACMCTLRVYT